MADFSFVTPRLATGAAVAGADDIQQLQAAGITHVIDCRAEFDDAPLLGPAFHYLWDGTEDDGQPKPVDWFAKGLQFGLPALATPGVHLYCHCAAGVNRGPSMTYGIMRALGWTAEDALALIHAKRPATVGGIRYAPDADQAVDALRYV